MTISKNNGSTNPSTSTSKKNSLDLMRIDANSNNRVRSHPEAAVESTGLAPPVEAGAMFRSCDAEQLLNIFGIHQH